MKTFKVVTAISMLILSLSLFYSCTQDTDILSASDVTADIESRDRGADESPTDESATMTFTNWEHFANTYRQLDDTYRAEGAEGLGTFAESLPFESQISKQLNDRFTNPEDRYIPTVADPIIRTLVNSHNEIIIEDKLLSFFTGDKVLMSSANNPQVRNQIRSLAKNTPPNIALVPDNAQIIKNEELELRFGVPCTKKIELVTDCDNPLHVTLEVSSFTFWWIPIDATVVVDWGDGTFETVTDAGNFSIEHTYNAPPPSGSFTIAGEIGNACNMSAPFGLDFIFVFEFNQHCDDDEEAIWDWAENGSLAMSYGLQVYTTWIRHYAASEVFSYVWTGNNWKRDDIDLIGVDVDAIWRSKGIALCQQEGAEDEAKGCGDCDDKRARINTKKKNRFHETGDVNGSFFVLNNGTSISRNLSLVFDCD